NWKAIWLEPRTAVVLTLGETKPYTVIGLTALETKADLTKSQNLNITSSDPTVLEVHRDKALLIGKKPGHVDIRISISGVAETVPAFVREPKTTVRNTIDGVWKALFTGDFGERPKMVSEILFAVNANGSALTGTVHAANWPGDGAILNGGIEGDRLSFQ